MAESNNCRHARTQLIAKDKDAEFVECLDCGALLEGEELERPAAPAAVPTKPKDRKDAPGFDESLSDA